MYYYIIYIYEYIHYTHIFNIKRNIYIYIQGDDVWLLNEVLPKRIRKHKKGATLPHLTALFGEKGSTGYTLLNQDRPSLGWIRMEGLHIVRI